VLRVTGLDGAVTRVSEELVSAETLPALAERARQRRQDEACKRDAERAQLVCTLHFDLGSSELDEDGERTLRRVLHLLREIHYREVAIEGHADDQGNQEDNFRLSQERADTAMKRLLEQGSEEVVGLVVLGLGDTRPLASNETEKGRALNRRVELRFKEDE
jgi:OOP family OmpA-OmpF porin